MKHAARVNGCRFAPIAVWLVARDVAGRWPGCAFDVGLQCRPGIRRWSVVVKWSDGPTEAMVGSYLGRYVAERRRCGVAERSRPGEWMPALFAVSEIDTRRTITAAGFDPIAATIERDCGVEVPRIDGGVDWERAAEVWIMGPIRLSGAMFERLTGTHMATMQGPVPVALALHMVSEAVDLTGIAQPASKENPRRVSMQWPRPRPCRRRRVNRCGRRTR